MNNLPILKDPDERLRRQSREIKNFNDPALSELITAMTKTMLSADGIGLAAPQVNHDIRLIIVNTKKGPLVCLNPLITKRSWRQEWGEEGCLSVPGVDGEVKRRRAILVNFQNQDGQTNKLQAKGLMARVFQHEIDHLDGILFIDKAKKIHQADTL